LNFVTRLNQIEKNTNKPSFCFQKYTTRYYYTWKNKICT
jgi:hypothetical protein